MTGNRPWLASYDDNVSHHIDYEDICLPDVLTRTATRFPDRVALVYEGTSLTYRELDTLVNRFASFLCSLGIKKGDVIAILLPNLVSTVVAYYGGLKAGAVVVMNNPLYTDYELEQQFRDSGARLLITLDLLAERMIALRKKTPIREIIYTTVGDYLPFPKGTLFRLFGKHKGLSTKVSPASHVYRWHDCLTGNDSDDDFPALDVSDVAMYQYTGGTTGISKGVILTQGNLTRQIQQFIAWAPEWAKHHETMMGALPFFHMFGLSTTMNLSIYVGWTSLLIPRPDTRHLLQAIERYRPTLATLVPTMIIGMMNDARFSKMDFTCFKEVVSGGAPIPLDVIRCFEANSGASIIEGFGLTEASPVTHVNPVGGKPRKPGSVGLPFPDTDCRIVDLERGTIDVPPGEAGELLIRGPQVMQGYLNMPDETRHALRDGWLFTGDIAKMDEDGYFYIIDRKKDLIISGGYNVYPRSIDEVFYAHPKIREACAIGIPDARRGEKVKVLVVLKDGEEATAEELMEFCRTRLARYKLPAEIVFRRDLPKSNIGKILRKDIRKEEMAGHTQ